MMTTTTRSSIRVKPSSAFLARSRLMMSCIGGASRTGCGGEGVWSSVALDVLVNREHREVQTNHHSADDGAHDEHHDRFDGSGKGFGGAVDFPVVEIGNFVEHLTDLTAFFPDLHHLGDHLGKD